MKHTKGGRGKKAPYESVTVRVPLPIQEVIQKICDTYRDSLDIDIALAILSSSDSDSLPLSESKAIDLAQAVLRSKKSAKWSMSKLLSGIYSKDIVL
jgi:hypothetical protein